MTPHANPCSGGYPSPYVGNSKKLKLNIDYQKALDGAVAKLTPVIDKYANDALKNIGKGLAWVWEKVECGIDPAKCRNRERKERYKALAGKLLEEAKKAASSGDYVTGYAFAQAALELDTKPPFTWYFKNMPGGGQLERISVQAKAEAMATGYRKQAELQAEEGKGGTFKPAAFPAWLPYAAGAAALLLVMGGRR